MRASLNEKPVLECATMYGNLPPPPFPGEHEFFKHSRRKTKRVHLDVQDVETHKKQSVEQFGAVVDSPGYKHVIIIVCTTRSLGWLFPQG